jgi:hypothetical protein
MKTINKARILPLFSISRIWDQAELASGDPEWMAGPQGFGRPGLEPPDRDWQWRGRCL